MRSERLTRKTHLKKHSALPQDGVAVCDLNQPQEWALSALLRGAAETSPAAAPEIFISEQDVLLWAVAVLNESPSARAMMIEAAGRGWTLGLTDLHTNGFYMEPEERSLLLDHFSMMPDALARSMYFRNALVTTLIRALRDIWHEERGNGDAGYRPEDILMYERARSADCDTVTLLCCWELRGAGFADVWRHFLGSAEGDMAMVFTRFLERDPGALFEGTALAYAFRQWYADETRVDASDHDTLETMDIVLSESGLRNPFGQCDLKPADLEGLSLLPDGMRYLAGLGSTIRHDPFFAGMNDPINQTHLFHLMYDMEVTLVNNVPFRDGGLARKIFPGASVVKTFR